MDCEHNKTATPKFIDDSLKALKTIERVTDNMMEEEADPYILNAFFGAARAILDQLCPREVQKRHPNLMDDENFAHFIEHLLHLGKEEANG